MNHTPRSRLLLIELVCDLLIFALCAVVCVSLLVRARSMSRESTELTDAVYLAQTYAERWREGGTGADTAADGYEIQHTRVSSDGGLPQGLISVFRDGRLIYELEVSLP